MKETLTVGELIEKLKLTEYNTQLLVLLLDDSVSRFEDFMTNYWTSSSEQFFAIERYREFRRQEIGMCDIEFVLMSNVDPKKALETLFLDVITSFHMKKLNNKLQKADFTFKVLYDLHKSNPNRSLTLLLK
jgi:hypothetical protein